MFLLFSLFSAFLFSRVISGPSPFLNICSQTRGTFLCPIQRSSWVVLVPCSSTSHTFLKRAISNSLMYFFFSHISSFFVKYHGKLYLTLFFIYHICNLMMICYCCKLQSFPELKMNKCCVCFQF